MFSNIHLTSINDSIHKKVSETIKAQEIDKESILKVEDKIMRNILDNKFQQTLLGQLCGVPEDFAHEFFKELKT